MIISRKHFTANWLYIQTNSLLAGIITGIIITCFQFVIYGASVRAFVGILIFSVLHAFAMAIAISLYTENLNQKISFKWIKVPALFLMGLLGTILATEFSYFLFAQLFRLNYDFLGHVNQSMVNFSICIIASAVVLLYESQRITYRNQFQKKEIEILRLKQLKIKEELEALQSKINPHFLYNSLNTIAALVYDQAALAEELTLKLSKLFRYSINYAQQNFSTIKEEIEMITVFLEIEKIRLGNRLSFKMNVPVKILNERIPKFLLQPLVENALKHGLANRAHSGEIEIEMSKEGKNILIAIYDNGQAFPQQVISGQGFQNTYEKLELMYPKQYEFKLIAGPRKHVRLLIPLKADNADSDWIQQVVEGY
ncbi:MAG: sensor histidine kinase [Sphingobacteriaceae bacterium]